MFVRRECRAVRRALWDYAAGSLREAEALRVEAHIACCERCRAEADGYWSAARAVGMYRAEPAPESATDWPELRRILAAEQAQSRRPMPSRRPTLAWGGAAAALLLGVIAAGGYFRIQRGGELPLGAYKPGNLEWAPAPDAHETAAKPAPGPNRQNARLMVNPPAEQVDETTPPVTAKPQLVAAKHEKQPVQVPGYMVDRPISPPHRSYNVEPAASAGAAKYVMGTIPESGMESDANTESSQEKPVW